MSDYIIQRGLFWCFFRRVPAEFADVDRRNIVTKSTKVRVAEDPDRRRARAVSEKINTALEAYWRDLASGQAAGARQRMREATVRARRLGFDYVSVQELAAGPLAEILRRVETLEARGLIPSTPTEESTADAEAVLGTAQEARVMVSGMFDEYQTYMRAELQKMSRERLRAWTSEHKRAAQNFLEVLGADKPVAALTRSDAVAFRRWWGDRIAHEGVKASSANVQIAHLSTMLDRVAIAHSIELAPLFGKLRFRNDSEQGVPFPTDWIRDRLLAPGALAELNDECRRVVYVMAETGLRPVEICGLDAKSIILDAKIPHLSIAPTEHRNLKTKTSRRLMPLVGVALKAMQAQPEGFTHYAGKTAALTQLINRFLRDKDLMPSEEHSLYSLRHSFKDRLRAVETPSELLDELMGHSNGRPAYGAGHALEQKRKWIQRIALPVPSKLAV